jgi:hypothetical protein
VIVPTTISRLAVAEPYYFSLTKIFESVDYMYKSNKEQYALRTGTQDATRDRIVRNDRSQAPR